MLQAVITDSQGEPSLLRQGETCWRLASADRVALLVDSASYFATVKAALANARHSILLLGWTFDPRTRLDPLGRFQTPGPDRIGDFLNHLSAGRPALDVRVLIWNMALPFMLRSRLFPQRAGLWLDRKLVDFRLDSTAPLAASHHQKIVVVDDKVAFCGGGDFAPERWDTTAHRANDPRRTLPSGERYPARHEVMMMVEGDAAAALGDLARERWGRATGEEITAPPSDSPHTVWPAQRRPDLRNVLLGIARTEPSRQGRGAVRENEALCLASIARARHTIYLENQYFSSPRIAAALEARLSEPNGPEVVVICSEHSPGFFDRLLMDAARNSLMPRLKAADRHGRFRIYGPRTDSDDPIIVHSKVVVIDNRLLRVGSSNLSNRSFGLDTECDLVLDAALAPDTVAARRGILAFRNHLLAHYLGASPEGMAEAIRAAGGVIAGIESLRERKPHRLQPIKHTSQNGLRSLIAKYHIGDPLSRRDAWRPWRRRRDLHDDARLVAAGSP